MEKYKDQALSSDERASDLLARMTTEEKLAQINIIRGVEFACESSKNGTCTVEANDDFMYDKIKETLGTRGIGYVHDIYSVPKIKNMVQRYMLEETRLGIPCIFTAEALHGISFAGASIFPVPLTLSQTFNPEIVKKIGNGIAAETRALGHHEILAPNLDVSRDPRWGRTEETFGEDTYLSSEMAAAIISGEQKGDISRSDSVISEPKHYCVHGMPEGGLNCAPARVGKREVETCYLPVFESGIKRGGAYNVMACYNSIDSELVMTSQHYLTEVLKERFGLRGISRADWGGVSRIENTHHLTRSRKTAIEMAINGGLDMQGCCDIPSREWEETILELINEGKVSISDIDDSVWRILKMKFELGLFEHPYADEEAYKDIVRSEHHKEVSLEAARQSIVLLKNDGVLPLKSVSSIALIGPSSAAQKVGGYSSEVKGYKINSVYDEIIKALPGVQIRQCDGCAITSNGGESVHFVDGQPHLRKTLDADISDMIDDAVEMVNKSEITIIVCGDNNVTSGEGSDRCHLTLNGRQRELIEKCSDTGKPVVLVLENGKSIDLSSETKVCAAIIVAGFGGEFGAKAIVEALTGSLNPAGRLSLSYPRDEGALPCYYSRLPGGSNGYLEGNASPLYPFGHGLSYTSFEYSKLEITELGRYCYEAAVTVTNTGKCAGDEVVQLYINDIDSSIVTPTKLLRGFKRISLDTGASERVTFKLNFDSFKLLSLDWKWIVEPGDFDIMIGASSSDIRVNKVINIK